MKTRAAVLRKAGTPWEITELELDPPRASEVLTRMEAAGLCHSDEHIRARGRARPPMVGGHEGAGVVVEAGPGITRVKAGDRISCSCIPVCGKCRYCSMGDLHRRQDGQRGDQGCRRHDGQGRHDRHRRRRVLRHGAARRHSYRLPQENAGLFVWGRQSAVRHPNDPELVAALATSSSRNSLPRNTPWTKLTRATKILWMVRASAASSSTSTDLRT